MLGTAPALEIVKQELADPTSDRVIEVLLLAQERGGSIVRSILDDLVEATTRDLKLRDELETEGLEMRINARAVVVLPWFVLVALTARPGPFRAFYRSPGGVVTLLVAAVLTAIGVLVLGRLGKEPGEQRVFGPAEVQR
jgi:tight adherence protein B